MRPLRPETQVPYIDTQTHKSRPRGWSGIAFRDRGEETRILQALTHPLGSFRLTLLIEPHLIEGSNVGISLVSNHASEE